MRKLVAFSYYLLYVLFFFGLSYYIERYILVTWPLLLVPNMPLSPSLCDGDVTFFS